MGAAVPSQKRELSYEEIMAPIKIDLKKPLFTLEDLNKYKTGDKIYVACKGVVYDVSKNEVYREGGGYHVFAGKDASVAFAKMNFNEENFDRNRLYWKRDLDLKGLNVMEEWVRFF